MSSTPQALQERFAALQASFLQQMCERLAEIDTLWPIAKASRSPADLKPVYLHVHNLCGTSAPLGFLRVSETAQQADALLRPLANQADPFSPDCIPQIETLLEELRQAAGSALRASTTTKTAVAS